MIYSDTDFSEMGSSALPMTVFRQKNNNDEKRLVDYAKEGPRRPTDAKTTTTTTTTTTMLTNFAEEESAASSGEITDAKSQMVTPPKVATDKKISKMNAKKSSARLPSTSVAAASKIGVGEADEPVGDVNDATSTGKNVADSSKGRTGMKHT